MAHQLQPTQTQHPSSPASALAGDEGGDAIALALQSTSADTNTSLSLANPEDGSINEKKTTDANGSRSSINNLKRTKVRSLVLLCTLKLIEHSRYIDDVGPYTGFHILEPVLAKVSPKHLQHLETRSPHLKLDSGKLWYAFIQRDFPKFKFLKKSANDDDDDCGDKKNIDSIDDVKKDPSFYRHIFEKLSFEQEKRRSKALDNLKKNYRMLELQKHSKSAVALDKETSIRMINMVANKKRKKMFFKDDISASSPIMKKVKRDLSSRNNLFRTQSGLLNGARPQLVKSPLFHSASSVVAKPRTIGSSISNSNVSGSGFRAASLNKSNSTTSVPVLRDSSGSSSGSSSVTSTGGSTDISTATRSNSSRSIDVVNGLNGPSGNSGSGSSSNNRPHAPSPLFKTHSRQISPSSARPKPSIFMPRSKPNLYRSASMLPEATTGKSNFSASTSSTRSNQTGSSSADSGAGAGSNSLVNSRPSSLSLSTKPRQSGVTSKLFQPTPVRNAVSQRPNVNTTVTGSTNSLSRSSLASYRPNSAHSRLLPTPPSRSASRPASTSRPMSANTVNNAGHYSTSTSSSARSVSAGRRTTRFAEGSVRSGSNSNDGNSSASNNEQRNRGGKLLTSSLFLNTKKY